MNEDWKQKLPTSLTREKHDLMGDKIRAEMLKNGCKVIYTSNDN